MSDTDKKIRPQLTHAGVWVRDMDAMVDFYTRVLGLEISDTGFVPRYGGRIAFLSNDPDIHHQVVFAEGRAEEGPSTVNQLSFTVASLDELRAMYRRAVAEGVGNLLPRNHGNAWSVYFDDPEGNNLEIYLDSPFHIPQPFGEPLDFELSNEEILQATEARCREVEGFMPRSDWAARRARTMDRAG